MVICCSYFSFSLPPSLSLNPLRGVSSRPSADWAPGVTFSNAPQISWFPRQDFFEFQKWIYWIFAIYLPFDRLTQTEASTCLMLKLIWCQRSVNESTLPLMCTCHSYLINIRFFTKLSNETLFNLVSQTATEKMIWVRLEVESVALVSGVARYLSSTPPPPTSHILSRTSYSGYSKADQKHTLPDAHLSFGDNSLQHLACQR